MNSKRVQMKKSSKRNIRKSRKHIYKLFATCIVMMLLIIGSSSILTKASDTETSQEVYYKYYTQIEIQHGDSLWEIAGKYMENGSYASRKEYMEEVIELNQLSSTKIIKGQHLIVPYFENTYK